MLQFVATLKSKQLIVGSLVVICAALLVGIPKISQPLWNGHDDTIEGINIPQRSIKEMNPKFSPYKLFSVEELPVERSVRAMTVFDRSGKKYLSLTGDRIIKSYSSEKRYTLRSNLINPISTVQSEKDNHGTTGRKGNDPRQREIRKPLIINIDRGRNDRKEVSLTFDGAHGERYASAILKTLRAKQIVTTIFVTGKFIERYPKLILEMVEDGHEIGNHTFTHPHLTSYGKNWVHHTLPGVDKKFVQKQLLKTAQTFRAVTGKDISPIWRAPYGEINKEILQWGYDTGFTHVFWTLDGKKRESLDTLDWVSDKESRFYHTSEEIKDKVLRFGEGRSGLNGGIILMHLSTQRSTDLPHLRLGEIIDGLREEGYRFVTVSKLIKELRGG
jgi:peptidoglycan/xylan/chitin deacetylase (PgdA/CDA1 family)